MLSEQLSDIQSSITESRRAVHHVPRTDLPHNGKFVPFDYILINFIHPLTRASGNYQSVLCTCEFDTFMILFVGEIMQYMSFLDLLQLA